MACCESESNPPHTAIWADQQQRKALSRRSPPSLCVLHTHKQQGGCYNALHAFLFSTAAGVINFASTSFSHIHSLIQGSYIFVLSLASWSLFGSWQYVLNVHEQIIHLRCRWGERARKCNGGHWSLRALRTPCTLYIHV
jgi:hypothetical protein